MMREFNNPQNDMMMKSIESQLIHLFTYSLWTFRFFNITILLQKRRRIEDCKYTILIEEIVCLRKNCGLPESFAPWGLGKQDFSFVVKNCRSGSMKSNPRSFTDEEVAALLERLI